MTYGLCLFHLESCNLLCRFPRALITRLTHTGTGIIRQVFTPAQARLPVRRENETGNLELAIAGENVRVAYTSKGVGQEDRKALASIKPRITAARSLVDPARKMMAGGG